MSELIAFDYNTAGRGALVRRLEELQRDLKKTRRAVRHANEKSLEWIQGRAQQELDKSIREHGRPQRFNSGKLRAAIGDPRYSTVSDDGFRFMVRRKVVKDVPYYRAIELGDDSQVGKRRVFTILAGNNRRVARSTSLSVDPVLGTKSPRRGDAFFGPRDRKDRGLRGNPNDREVGVLIRNPVPAYRYSEKAADAFFRAGLYTRFLNDEIEKAGGLRLSRVAAGVR